jgi:hypothetical protein
MEAPADGSGPLIRRTLGPGMVRGRMGRLSSPFVRLELSGTSLSVYVLPKWLGKMMGAHNMFATLGPQIHVFPARGFFGLRCVGIESNHETDAYVWTSNRDKLLNDLRRAGCDVSLEERRVKYPPY